MLFYIDIWVWPKVIGAPPKPCSECTFTRVGQDRAILLGGTGKGIGKGNHDFRKVKILDMSSTSMWVCF